MKFFLVFFLVLCQLAGQATFTTVPLPGANGYGSAMVVVGNTVFVAAGGTLSAIDIPSGNVLATATIGINDLYSWNQICVTPKGVMVADGSAGYPTPVTIMDPVTLAVTRSSIPIAYGYGCATSPDQKTIAFVSVLTGNQFANIPRVVIVDSNLNLVWQSPPEETAYDQIIAVGPDKYYAYSNDAGTIEVVNHETVTGVILLGGKASGHMELSPDGRYVIVPLGSQAAAIVQTATDTIVDSQATFDTVLGRAGVNTIRFSPGDMSQVFEMQNGGTLLVRLGSLPSGMVRVPMLNMGNPDGSVGNLDLQVMFLPSGQRMLIILQSSQVLFQPVTRYPFCTSLVNSATGQAGPLQPGSWATMYCGDAGGAPQLTNGYPYPTKLGSTSVQLQPATGGAPVPMELMFSSANQITFLTPGNTPIGVTDQVVALVDDGSGSVTPVPANPLPLTTSMSSPGIYAMLDLNGWLISPGNPAASGSLITLLCTGIGPVNATIPTGQAAPTNRLVATLALPSVMFGNIPGQVLFAGLAPGSVGLYEIEVIVPPNAGTGNVSIQVQASGATSPVTALAVQQ